MFIFGNKRMTQSPTMNQSIVWLAEYADGTHLSEYDFETHQSNSFYSINKEKVIKFGLLGEGNQVYFDVGNGIFTINNNRFTISYISDDKEYPLTGRALIYNDLITYKDAVADGSILRKRGTGRVKSMIQQYNVGYKKQMELNEANIYFQCVLGLPLMESAYFQISISSDIDMDGYLVVRRNGKVVDNIKAPLIGGMRGQTNWTLK